MVASFSEDSHVIQTADEFLQIHERNLAMLTEHIKLTNDSFTQSVVESIPIVDRKEVIGFIERDRGEKKITDYLGWFFGWIFLVIGSVHKRTDPNAGRMKKDTIQKLKTLSNKNLTIISIIENSGY